MHDEPLKPVGMLTMVETGERIPIFSTVCRRCGGPVGLVTVEGREVRWDTIHFTPDTNKAVFTQHVCDGTSVRSVAESFHLPGELDERAEAEARFRDWRERGSDGHGR